MVIREAAQTRGGGWRESPRFGWRVNCAAMLRKIDSHYRPPGYEPGELLLLHSAMFVHRAVRDRFAGAKLRNNIVLCKKSASYQKGGAKDGREFTALFGGYFSP